MNSAETSKLDLRVITEVMGSVECENWHVLHYSRGEWIRRDKSCGHEVCHPKECIPHFSTNVNAAFQVVEKMRERCRESGKACQVYIDNPFGMHWHVGFGISTCAEDFHIYEEEHEDAPMAICLSALAALKALDTE